MAIKCRYCGALLSREYVVKRLCLINDERENRTAIICDSCLSVNEIEPGGGIKILMIKEGEIK